jgi:hypothetical protein
LLQPTAQVCSTPGDAKSKDGKRAWELLEMTQLIPIKLLENGSLNPSPVALSSFASLVRNQVSQHSAFFLVYSLLSCLIVFSSCVQMLL